MTSDLHALKPFTCGDGDVSLRIPRRWIGVPHEKTEGRWGCYDDDSDAGTLWIDVVRHHINSAVEEDILSFATLPDAFMDDVVADSRELGHTVVTVPGGRRTEGTKDFVEDGVDYRTFTTRFLLTCPAHIAFISFNYVLSLAQLRDPVFIEQKNIVDRAVKAAFLDPFKEPMLEAAFDRWGGLQYLDMDGGVRIVVPQEMDLIAGDDMEDDDSEIVIGRLGSDDSFNSVIFRLETFESFAVSTGLPFDEVGSCIDKAVGDLVCKSDWHVDFRPLPFGGIGREDTDEATIWRRIHADETSTRVLHVSAFVAKPPGDVDDLHKLVAYLDGALYRAEFVPIE